MARSPLNAARTAVHTVRDYHRSRPYHLVPWIALLTAAALWPKPAPEPPPPLPGMSEPRIMEPHAFEAEEPGRGRIARHPLHIPPLGWKDIAWRVYREMGADRIPAVAGGVTFYVLLAIFPAIGVFVAVYGLIADVHAVQDQLNRMAAVFPPDVLHIIGDQMLRVTRTHQATLSAAFVVSLLLSVWSANAGMKALVDGLNIAYDEEEKREYLHRTAVTYLATLGGIVFLALVTAVLVAAPFAFRAIGFGDAWWWWIPLRWLVVFAIAAGAFALMYRFGPCRRPPRWRWVTLGGVAAALTWLGGSLGYSWYVNNIAHFSVTYGSLGAAVGFMVWIWFSVVTVLMGAELNAEIEHQTAIDSTVGPEKPMGERGAAMADSVGKSQTTSPKEAAQWAGGVVMRNARRVGGAVKLNGKAVKAPAPVPPPGPDIEAVQKPPPYLRLKGRPAQPEAMRSS